MGCTKLGGGVNLACIVGHASDLWDGVQMDLGPNRGSTPMQGPCPDLEAQAWVILGEKGGF